MNGIDYLKKFDSAQLWRLFVDGRFHSKGWRAYEAKELGTVQAMLNGFSYMLDNFDLSSGLDAHYLVMLHKICMFNVDTENFKSTPGDIRFLSSGMPIFNKSGTYENIVEILKIRKDDSTIVFNTKPFNKIANKLDADVVFGKLQELKRLSYRPWYPEIDKRLEDFLNKKGSLEEYYEAKYYVQKLFAKRIETLVSLYNKKINQVNADKEKIVVISKLVRDLELLHPFPDGNCRVFASVLLNHLLIYHDFPPVILNNPNLDGEVSYSQFEKEIYKGFESTRLLLNNKEAVLFNYSITNMPEVEVTNFLNMAAELISKISKFPSKRTENQPNSLYLTPDILQRITAGKWLNYDPNVRYLGVGSHTTVGKDFLYYCFSKDWEKQKKDVLVELSKIIKRGASGIVIDNVAYAKHIDIPVLVVDDTGKAMERVAIETRREIPCDSVLVTGTVGKTSFKIQLHHCLKNQINVHAFLNSINTKVPVIRSLSSLKTDDQLEIVELSVGRSSSDAEERSHWIAPNICVFTDIGENHMNIHKTTEHLIYRKASVVAGLKDDGICIINRDAQFYNELVVEIKKRNRKIMISTFGSSDNSDAYLIDAKIDSKNYGWSIRASIEGEIIEYSLPLFQKYAPVQSLGVLLVVKRLGYDVNRAALAYKTDFSSFESMGRLFKLDIDDKKILFYDQSFRGSIQGMRSAFEDISNFAIKGRKIFVIAGTSVEEDSVYTKEQHIEIAEMINVAKVDKLFTTGPYIDYIHNSLDDKAILVNHSDNLEELAEDLRAEIEDGDFLFIMGSGYLYLGRLGKQVLSMGRSVRLR